MWRRCENKILFLLPLKRSLYKILNRTFCKGEAYEAYKIGLKCKCYRRRDQTDIFVTLQNYYNRTP